MVNRCPDCNEVPKEKDGILTCGCSRTWQHLRAERGTAEEERRLADNGFEYATSADGDLYYVGPLDHIIHLYPNGEWDSDKAPANCSSLETYFELLRQATDIVPANSSRRGWQ